MVFLLRSWSGYGDELVWSAAWLHRVTGETAYGDRAKELWDEFEVPYKGGWGTDVKYSAVKVPAAPVTLRFKYIVVKTAAKYPLPQRWQIQRKQFLEPSYWLTANNRRKVFNLW